MPAAAWADCVANGTTVTCSGSSAAYTYNGTGAATVTADSTATVAAPLIVAANGSTLTNNGTITNAATTAGIQMGDGTLGTVTVLNKGTITSTATSGSGAISVGNNATVENAGTLTAYAGTPAVSFGTNGTFQNDASATAAVTGNIVFGTNVTGTTTTSATFINNNTAYGFTGNVTATGNINATNTGIYTGNFVQTAVQDQSTVSFTNSGGGTFTGILSIGANANVVNTGANSSGTASVMYLYPGSVVGSFYAGSTSGTSTFRNEATLYVGTTAAPAQLKIYGSFTQTAAGTLNLAIIPAGTSATSAGTTYSQIATTGTATIDGKVNVNVVSGFYASGTTYKLISAAGGLTYTGTPNILSASGTPLIFVKFNSATDANNLVLTACHVATSCNPDDYASALTTALTGTTTPITANQTTMAKSLDKLVVAATGDSSSDAAQLLGYVDVLSANQAQTFLDSLSPEGYLAYGIALRDQANSFARQIDLRMQDQNSNHDEDGWWGSIDTQFQWNSRSYNGDGYNRTKQNQYAINIGYDFSGPHHVYGGAISFGSDKLSLATGSLSGSNRDIAFALYGAQNLGRLRVSGQVAYNAGHLSATKTLNLYTTTLTAYARTNEYMFKALGQVGYDLHAGGYLIEPFVGVDYNKGQVNAFTETNGGAGNLAVGKINADHTDLLVGGSIARDHGKFRPYAKLTYRERLSGSALNLITASLAEDTSNTAFSISGVGTRKGELDTNAGINWVFDDAGSLFVGYQGTVRTGLQSHGINLGIRIEF